jgi:DNA-binding SARP family transcriptional activator
VRLRTFGGIAIEGAARALGGAAGQHRPLALLLLLAASGARGVSRDKLVGLLWPDSDAERARNALRQTLYTLRRDLEAQDLTVGTVELRLNSTILASDLGDFDAAVKSGDRDGVVRLYAGPLADGFFLNKAPEFERWLDDERRLRAQQFAESVEALASQAARDGDHVRSAALWRKLAGQDRLSARTALRLMRALAAAGDREAAIEHSRLYERIVRAELEAEPDPAVAALADELRKPERLPPPPRRLAEAPAVQLGPGLTSVAEPCPAVSPYSFPETLGDGPPTATTSASQVELPPPAGTDNSGQHATLRAGSPLAAPAPPVVTPAERVPDSGVLTGVIRATRSLRVRLALYAAVGVFAAAFFWRWSTDGGSASDLDDSLYLVLPFRTIGDSSQIGLTADQSERVLYEAMSRWQDVRLVDPLRVGDMLARQGPPRELTAALAAARAFEARHLIWGTLSRFRDTIRVQALLYDAASEDDARSASVRLPANLVGIETRFRELADSLLVGRSRAPPTAAGDEMSTTRVAAWRAYDRGHTALEQWKLEEAARELRAATELDPQFARAWFWLGQVVAWSGEDSAGDGRLAARRAVELRGRLSPRDQIAAAALAALGSGDHPTACLRYRELLQRDSSDFAAWYGLGECQAKDSIVVDDARSPSAKQFRTSYHGATAAYARALDLVPSFHLAIRDRAYARLASLFFTLPGQVRYGIQVRGMDTLVLAAWPAREGDTLAFTPYPIGAFRASRPGTNPPTRSEALAHNRLQLRRIAEAWVRSFPTSVAALEALTLALESLGEIGSTAGRDGALATVRRARKLPTASDAVALRLAAAEVRLLVKADSLPRARSLADSILSSSTIDPAPQDTVLAAVAAVVGEVNRAADLLVHGAPAYVPVTPLGRPVTVPVAIRAVALRLGVFAAFGGPPDSIRAAENRLDRLIKAHVAPQRQPRVRSAVLYVPLRLAYSDLSARKLLPPDVDGDPLIQTYQASERSEHVSVRTHLGEVQARRANLATGDVSPEVLLQEVLLWMRSADTASAVRVLDQMLEAIPTGSAAHLSHPFGAAALVRAMALRATVAASSGDEIVARRWSNAVLTLWSDADPHVQSIVARMRRIAGANSSRH